MLLPKSLSMENQTLFVRTRIAWTSVLIFMRICSSAKSGWYTKYQKLLALVCLFEALVLHETVRVSVPNQISCEINDDAKLLMEITSSIVIRGHPILDKTVTKITSPCRIICMKMLWFSVVTCPPPINGAIVCWDSATSTPMLASVAVLKGSFYLRWCCEC